MFILIFYIEFKFHSKENITILCEEKKTKLFWYTYKFGILKYLVADKNEVGGILFNIINRNVNQVIIPTGYLTGKNGWDSVLYNVLNHDMVGIQYKNKIYDCSLFSEKQFISKISTIFRESYHCDQLIIDTSETNVKLLDNNIYKHYPKFYHLIVENKIVFFNSDEFLNQQDSSIMESEINENNKNLEQIIIEKNNKAESIIRSINEVGDDPRFNEIGNWNHSYWANGKMGPYSVLDKEYVKIMLLIK